MTNRNIACTLGGSNHGYELKLLDATVLTGLVAFPLSGGGGARMKQDPCTGWKSILKPACPKCAILSFCATGQDRLTPLPPERVREIMRGMQGRVKHPRD